VSKPNGRPEEAWKRFSQLAKGHGMFDRPVRFLVLATGTLALMEEHFRGHWCIFATTNDGKVGKKSDVYRTKSIAELIFREMAEEMAEPEKEQLAQRMLKVPYEEMTVEQKLQAANDGLKYLRLRAADEDTFEGSMVLAERLSPEEVTSYIQESINARTRQEAAETE
jgi:arginine/lysine/ornithine decarboxylase